MHVFCYLHDVKRVTAGMVLNCQKHTSKKQTHIIRVLELCMSIGAKPATTMAAEVVLALTHVM